MPSYTYLCPTHGQFELTSSIADYKPKVTCSTKKCRKKCERALLSDASTVGGLGDVTPKTLGMLADKKADKLSIEEKASLYKKHNAYKEGNPDKPLPKGMSRIEKPKEREVWT